MPSPRAASDGSPPVRTARDDRRDELLDAAAYLLAEGGPTAVSMDAVAAQTGFSRPLVYKHFANREELIAELWRRETRHMDTQVMTALVGVEDFETIVRTSVETIIDVLQRRDRTFAPLIRGQVLTSALKAEQRARSRRTRAWYTDRIVAEFGIDQADAEAAVAVYFAGLDSMLADWRGSESATDPHRLVEVYVDLVMGGLRSLQRDRQPVAERLADRIVRGDRSSLE